MLEFRRLGSQQRLNEDRPVLSAATELWPIKIYLSAVYRLRVYHRFTGHSSASGRQTRMGWRKTSHFL